MSVNELLLAEYDANYDTYKRLEIEVRNKINEILANQPLTIKGIESRVKSRESLIGKLNLKGYKYHKLTDITDIFGIRIITLFSDAVDIIATLVEKNFVIDFKQSTDKRKIHNIDQFGYMSLHYIAYLENKQNSDDEIYNIPFEIQIRSNLQHTWASIYHDTGYKSNIEVPNEYLRGLNRLASLLELADENFVALRNSIDEYRHRIKQIIKDNKLEDIELNIDSFNEIVANGLFEPLNKRIASINKMEIEEVSLRPFLAVFKSLGFKTLKDVSDLVKDYSDIAYEFSIREFYGLDLDIITNMIGPLNLCICYIIKQNLGAAIIKLLLDNIYSERKSNTLQAHKLYLIGVEMGLTTEEL